MAKDDYHVIVYQILSYLYSQLKAGEPVDPILVSADNKNFTINEQYWQYIMVNLMRDGYIVGASIEEKKYLTGPVIVIRDLEYLQITPKGIDYLIDNSFMKKVGELVSSAANIVPFVGLFK